MPKKRQAEGVYCDHCKQVVSRRTEYNHRKGLFPPILISSRAGNASGTSDEDSDSLPPSEQELTSAPLLEAPQDDFMEDVAFETSPQDTGHLDIQSPSPDSVRDVPEPPPLERMQLRSRQQPVEIEETDGESSGEEEEDDEDDDDSEDAELTDVELDGLESWDADDEDFERELAELGAYASRLSNTNIPDEISQPF